MANGIVLSILIPTIVGRESQFETLHTELNKQLQAQGIWNEIEILSSKDDRTMSIGDKRQLLLTQSFGDYCVFIDDDDRISEDYCISLWRAIKNNPDIDSIGFLQECIINKSAPQLCSISVKWKDWANSIEGFDYVRTPFFPTPIKRSICIEIGYNDLRFGEDYDFAMRLKNTGLIQKEYFINKVLYYYQYTHQPHHIKYGKPNEQHAANVGKRLSIAERRRLRKR